MNKALDFIKKQGIDTQDIKTQQYSINPRYETTACEYKSGSICPPASIAGYTVQQSVFVKIRDFKLISSLLTGVVENGANSVGQIQFAIDNTDSVENAARAEAIEKAKAKAKSIAEAGGFTLGRLLEISENAGGMNPYYSRGVSMDMVGAKEGYIAPVIEAGSQEVEIQVTLRYEIQ